MEDNKTLPGISCLCITYSRVDLLEESIECFLRQTYKGPKELLILNDCDDQILKYDHPEITIVNTPVRFRTIGEKRNASVGLAKYNILTPWDDDDIFLPHKLEHTVNKMMQNGYDYYKVENSFFYCMNNGILNHGANLFFCASVFTRDAYLKTKGHGFITAGEDAYLENQLRDLSSKKLIKGFIENTRNGATLKDIYYIYRFGGISSHLSVFATRPDALEFISNDRKSKKDRPVGVINLNPHWEKDYVQIANDYIAKQI